MKKNAIFMILIISMLVITAGCGKDQAKKTKNDSVPVRVMMVKLENLQRVLEYVGNIKGQNETLVYPKVTGKIIEKVKEDGCPIAKGEVITYIDRDEVGMKFEKAPVESPLTGVVGRVYVDIGSTVTTQTPVALVTDMQNAEIDLDVPEKYLPKVSLGQIAEIMVDAYPGEVFTGEVKRISPVVDLGTRSAPIEIIIENSDLRLQSGMFAKVKLIIDERKGVPVILREAVIGKVPNTYVYVIDSSKAKLVKVALGLRQGPYFEVTEGLKVGDLVVTVGQQKLRDGASVIVEE